MCGNSEWSVKLPFICMKSHHSLLQPDCQATANPSFNSHDTDRLIFDTMKQREPRDYDLEVMGSPVRLSASRDATEKLDIDLFWV